MAENIREELAALLPSGTVIYFILRHVSKSGNTRAFSAYVWKESGPYCLDGVIYQAGLRIQNRAGHLVTREVGTDVGAALVNDLRRYLTPGIQNDRLMLHHQWL